MRDVIKRFPDSLVAKVGMDRQHFMLIPRFTVVENLMLGAEMCRLLSVGRK